MRNVTLPNEELLPEVVKMLSEGSRVSLKAKGASMLPFIVGGRDHVLLEKKETYTVGEIVMAEIAPKQFVVHRILKIDDKYVTLMGDGNLSGTEVCPKENICGYVAHIVHNGKQIDCNSAAEQRKAQFWKNMLPIRRYLLAIYRRII